jgi:hypothetical protein
MSGSRSTSFLRVARPPHCWARSRALSIRSTGLADDAAGLAGRVAPRAGGAVGQGRRALASLGFLCHGVSPVGRW